MAYITEGDLENYILQDIDASYSAWITDVIAAVEAYVDQYCGTDFQNAASTDRYYDGDGSDTLTIDPVQSITAIYFLDTNGNVMDTLTSADYLLYPLNDSNKTQIKLQGGSFGSFPNYYKSVKITGTFGYSTAPLPVKMAAIKLAAKIINNGLRGGKVTSETLGSYSVSFAEIDAEKEKKESMEIFNILDMYRVITLD